MNLLHTPTLKIYYNKYLNRISLVQNKSWLSISIEIFHLMLTVIDLKGEMRLKLYELGRKFEIIKIESCITIEQVMYTSVNSSLIKIDFKTVSILKDGMSDEIKILIGKFNK